MLLKELPMSQNDKDGMKTNHIFSREHILLCKRSKMYFKEALWKEKNF
jgi:hypothetical protein